MKARKVLLTMLGVAAITVGLLALVEGLASILLTVRDVARVAAAGPLREAMPDTLLGWINRPGFSRIDMFGPGAALTINSRSMRDDAEVPEEETGLRLICSGDSFTFGLGVGDSDTWCARLERHDSRLRTLNFGASGYGVDQSYLRYRRDGESLDHGVHIAAFIPDDIRRLRLARFNGYPKPYYRMLDGQVKLENVPVPDLSGFDRIMLDRERLVDLRLVQFANRVAGRNRSPRVAETVNSDEEAVAIAVELMDSLAASARRHDRLAVFVLLAQKFSGDEIYDALEAGLTDQLGRRGLLFIDLRKEQRALPADSLQALFSRTWGHYTVRGNQWVAERLWLKLNAMPDFQRQLTSTNP